MPRKRNITAKEFSEISTGIRLSTHEKICAERMKTLFKSMDEVKREIKTQNTRKATHYFGGSSSVLDYILLSCEFDANSQNSFFDVSAYDTYDRHLINPIFERDGNSTDHGVVMITLTLRE